jgi:membrane protease YdiL (CAAX protease family)
MERQPELSTSAAAGGMTDCGAPPALPLRARKPLNLLAQVGLYYAAASLADLLLARFPHLNGGVLASGIAEYVLAHEAIWAVLSVGVTALFWQFLDRLPAARRGLRPPTGRQWAAAVLFGLAPMVAVYPVALATGHLRVDGFETSAAALLLYRLALYVALSVSIAAAEEVPFRGYLLPNLAAAGGAPAGVAVSSLLFVAIHWVDPVYHHPLSTLQLAMTAVGFAWLRLGAGTLLVPVAAHAVYDLALFLLVGDPDLPGVLRTRVGPESLWLGGARTAGLVDLLVTAFWLAGIRSWMRWECGRVEAGPSVLGNCASVVAAQEPDP